MATLVHTYIENLKDLFIACCLKRDALYFLTIFPANTVATYLKI